MTDPHTMFMRLCDDDGIVRDGYLGTLNRLRAATGANFYDGPPFACTGSAHLAGEHIGCTSPAHSVSIAKVADPSVAPLPVIYPWDRDARIGVFDPSYAYTATPPQGGRPSAAPDATHATAAAVATDLPLGDTRREYVIELHLLADREADVRDVGNLVHDAVRGHSKRPNGGISYELLHTTVTEPRPAEAVTAPQGFCTREKPHTGPCNGYPSVWCEQDEQADPYDEPLYEPWYVRLAHLWWPEGATR